MARKDDLRTFAAKVALDPIGAAEKALRVLDAMRARTAHAWKAKVPQPADDARTVQHEAELRALLRAMPQDLRRETFAQASGRCAEG